MFFNVFFRNSYELVFLNDLVYLVSFTYECMSLEFLTALGSHSSSSPLFQHDEMILLCLSSLILNPYLQQIDNCILCGYPAPYPLVTKKTLASLNL